jgi:hypothetical protein
MTKAIRFGVAAAAALAFLPAWGSDASFEDKREVEQSEQRPADAVAPPALQGDSAAQEPQQQRADEGSGAGEPTTNERDQDKRLEQEKAARERFLNEVWTAP